MLTLVAPLVTIIINMMPFSLLFPSTNQLKKMQIYPQISELRDIQQKDSNNKQHPNNWNGRKYSFSFQFISRVGREEVHLNSMKYLVMKRSEV